MIQRLEYNGRLIGQNLRRCRKRKNLTVEDVREYLRLGSVQAIYKWEEGRNLPLTDTMIALMELYEIGVKDLLFEAKCEGWLIWGNFNEADFRFIPQIADLGENIKNRRIRAGRYYERWICGMA